MRVVVVGGGTGGATFAGTLAAAGRHEVTLVEAGPDYGPFAAHRWPSELLDSRRIPLSHDWGLRNADPSGRGYDVARARVMGGCSSHNGCAAVRGLRHDFEGWAQAGGSHWAPAELLEDFAAVERALRVRTPEPDEVTPFQHDVRDAARALGFPVSADINDIDEGESVSVCPVNKRGGVRWNAGFAFVDPVRGTPGFMIVDRCTIDDFVWAGGRVAGVRGRRDGVAIELAAEMVVVAAGAYGSPELLMRAGIGARAVLEEAGLAVRRDLPGVGRNLQDHPCAVVELSARPALIERMTAFEARGLAYDEAIIVKARSPEATIPVDIHVFSSGGRVPGGGWYWQLWAGLLAARSRGAVRPVSDAAGLRFVIEHCQLTDPDGHDLRALRWGVGLARRMAGQHPLADMLEEVAPGPLDDPALDRWIGDTHVNYYHPAGTCAMGSDPAAGAVVDGMGRVHGVPGLMVADASIMPVVTAGNTNIPTAALAHCLARRFDP